MRCVLITPFGVPVEPDVNRILATVSGPTRANAASTRSVGCVASSSATGVDGLAVGDPAPAVACALGEKRTVGRFARPAHQPFADRARIGAERIGRAEEHRSIRALLDVHAG